MTTAAQPRSTSEIYAAMVQAGEESGKTTWARAMAEAEAERKAVGAAVNASIAVGQGDGVRGEEGVATPSHVPSAATDAALSRAGVRDISPDDLQWCASHMDDDEPAPTRAAHSLRAWARSDDDARTKFYTVLMPKVLQHGDDDARAASRSLDRLDATLRRIVEAGERARKS